MVKQTTKPIRISEENYESLHELKIDVFGTENATYNDVLNVLIEAYNE